MSIKVKGLEVDTNIEDVDIFEVLSRVEMLESVVAKLHYQLNLLEKNAEETASLHETLDELSQQLQAKLTTIEKTKLQ